MITLSNDQLDVELVDPDADRTLLGARYCAGGYIHQIADHQRGPLLAGPTYPDRFEPFHGQGIPDAFNLSPLREIGAGDEAAIIGVGLVRLHKKYRENSVIRFDPWTCSVDGNRVDMTTTQRHAGWAWTLQRRVELHFRTVISNIHFRNEGEQPIPVRWFPHPFFPQPAGDRLCRINTTVQLAPNPGYRMGEDGWICRTGLPDPNGHYLALDHDATAPVEILQRHPEVAHVSGMCSYAPALLPIWGNDRTFSWEPFFERTAAPGHELRWSVHYTF